MFTIQAFIRIAVVSVSLAYSVAQAQLSQKGAIAGVVTDDSGKVVPHAMVIAYLRYSSSGETTPVLKSAESRSDGSFSIDELDPGSYLVCAELEGRALLNPCDWSAKPPAWNLAPGELARVNVTMEEGVFLHFRVHDDEKHIAKAKLEGKPLKYDLAVVTRRQSMRALQVTSADANGENLRCVVPKNSAVDYLASASEINLTDSRDADKIANGRRNTLRTQDGEKVIELTARKK